MKKTKALVAATLLAGSVGLVATNAQAWWGDDWGGPWWGGYYPYWGGPWGGYPYWGGYPGYWGGPWGWGGYPGYWGGPWGAYPYAAPAAKPSTEKSK